MKVAIEDVCYISCSRKKLGYNLDPPEHKLLSKQ